MVDICISYSHDIMGYYLPYQTHTWSLSLLCCHSINFHYGLATYFVKFHTFPIASGMGIVWVGGIPITYDA